MKVYVIIVTYNGKQWYDACFGSLRLSEIPLETVVIDNASSDDTVAYITQHYPEVTLIQSTTNLGFGQANNVGIRKAMENSADYVFLLNQDAWIYPDTIATLVTIAQNNTEYGILSPVHLTANKTAIEKDLLHWIADYKVTDSCMVSDLFCHQKLKDVYNTTYVNAAAWLLPKSTLETIGGFDPIFFHYGEDDNYMSRVLFHGFKIGICPVVTVCHDTVRKVRITSDSQKKSREKELLIELADIYKEININNHILYHIRKVVVLIMKLKFSTAKFMYQRCLFILKNKKQVIKSKNQNKQKGKTWL